MVTKDSREKNLSFYKGKRVLVTGHTGFKGAWLTAILYYLQAEAIGYALEPAAGCLYERIGGDSMIHSVCGDLSDQARLEQTIREFQPEIVLHLAAFGFVKECYEDPVRAYETNLMGSLHLLEALRKCDRVGSIVMVSTDKVYENHGDGVSYREADRLGGIGPYSGSKTCMEYLIQDYRETYFLKQDKKVGLASVRASNVLGGGDHVQFRLIPTILHSVVEGKPVEIRNPDQTRPWQCVLDALNGYLSVARLLYQKPTVYSEAWNIGPAKDGIRSVGWIFETINRAFHLQKNSAAKGIGVMESQTLGLNIEKSMERLDWEPILPIERTIEQVVDFYKCQQSGEAERDICMRQIDGFYGGQSK